MVIKYKQEIPYEQGKKRLVAQDNISKVITKKEDSNQQKKENKTKH